MMLLSDANPPMEPTMSWSFWVHDYQIISILDTISSKADMLKDPDDRIEVVPDPYRR